MIEKENMRSWWAIPLAAILISSLYLPTLRAPFDFIDDGNLVYPACDSQDCNYVVRWWERVVDNYDHLGPFRPVLWAHWELAANLFDGDPTLWRLARHVWCALAAGMMLKFLLEMRFPFRVAFLTTAFAMANPFRNEIWTSLTLSEGVAMPYAFLGLIAARRASQSHHAWFWEMIAIGSTLMAIGCKNTFVALVPAQIALAMLGDGMSFKENLRIHGLRSLKFTFALIPVAIHYAYFKLHWHPGQYETHGFNLEQLGRILKGLKGAIGLDFLGAGLVGMITLLTLHYRQTGVASLRAQRTPLLAGGLLLLGGAVVYAPLQAMSGRYTMPAVWGFDLILAVLLNEYFALKRTPWKKATTVVLVGGLIAMIGSHVMKQEKKLARSQLLWDVLLQLEKAPPTPRYMLLDWVSGRSEEGDLNEEEGIHFAWHLKMRNRVPLWVRLVDKNGVPVNRVELPVYTQSADYRMSSLPMTDGKPTEAFQRWDLFHRVKYECHLANFRRGCEREGKLERLAYLRDHTPNRDRDFK